MSKWVVDTCVIIDVLSGDGVFSAKSADAIDMKRAEGLVVAPITYVELAPSFLGDVAKQDLVLSGLGIECDFAGNKRRFLLHTRHGMNMCYANDLERLQSGQLRTFSSAPTPCRKAASSPATRQTSRPFIPT